MRTTQVLPIDDDDDDKTMDEECPNPSPTIEYSDWEDTEIEQDDTIHPIEVNLITTKRTILGGFLIAVAQLLFGINEVWIKLFHLKISQLGIVAFSVELLCAVIYWKIRKPSDINHWYGDTKHDRINIWCRGLLMSTAFLFWYACIRLPLGDMQCILYQSPVWVVFLSWLIFGDKLPKFYILIPSALLTLSGIIFVTQPGFIVHYNDQTLPIDGVIAILFTCARWVASILLVKQVEKVHFCQYEFSTGICTLFITFPLMITVNTLWIKNEFLGTLQDVYAMEWGHILISVYIGITTFIAVISNIYGYQIGNATTVSWLEYINIPISFIYQQFIFNDILDLFEIAGGIMVLTGSILPALYQIYIYCVNSKRERRIKDGQYQVIVDKDENMDAISEDIEDSGYDSIGLDAETESAMYYHKDLCS